MTDTPKGDLGEAFFEQAASEVAAQQQQPPATNAPVAAPAPQSPANPAATTNLATPSHGDLGDAFFEQALSDNGEASPAPPAQPQQQQQQAPVADPGSLPLPTGIDDATIDPRTLGAAGAALGLGAAKGVFATKDFFADLGGFWGDTPAEQDRSALRQSVDAQSARLTSNYGEPYSLTEGLAQGAVGLLGASKLEWGGMALKAAVGALGTAASFEPHAANFMNLVQSIPGMDGPVTRFLASDPNDSTALGYAKNALASLGVEGAAVGLFAGTAATLKALHSGDKALIEAASADLEKAFADHLAERSAANGSLTDDGANPASPRTTYSANSTGLTASPAADTVVSEPLAGNSAASATSAVGIDTTAPKPFAVDTGSIERILGAWGDDEKALIKYGSWDAAIANGHTFGGEDKIPWQVLATGADGQPSTSMDALLARVSAGYATLAEDLKGGAVQTDAMNAQAVERRAALWNEDPSTLLGMLHAAGERAGELRADMQASYAVAQRCMQDTWTMASRINIGDFSEWGGSRDAALLAVKQQTGIAATLLASAQSIRANAGRAMRGLRSDFKLDPMMVRNLASLDGEALVSMLTTTKGDPMALRAALQPGMLSRLAEGAQLYLVNNLISNPLTHAIIFGSNLWQALARPAMRAAGSLANQSWDTVGREAVNSYAYMASAIPDAYRSAVQAFRTGDSILAPHSLAGDASGGAQASTGLGQAIAQAQFRDWNNIGDVLRNTLLAGAKLGTFPTRAVGFQDELVKQVVYRGKVQAKALVEGQAAGLTGDELTQYVKGKLYDSFDSYGRATDGDALREAATATYQNDLNPTGHIGGFDYATQGYALQRYLQNNPLPRIIVPFVRTPVNLFRQGVQLTPGLNLIQAEYRDAINGVYGAERQAQAIGQMGMGTLIMGTAGLLAYQGLITGNAPVDPKLAAEAMQDGWRPNSIVIPHKDGSRTYVPFDRFDPVMMPLAMAANIVNVLKSPEVADKNKAESMTAALALSLFKALTDKLYLQHLSQTIDFALDPDRHGGAYLGGIAANYVPASSLLHLVNPDPVMREADDFVSAMLGRVPGFSKDFPARRDWAGDAITVHKGLWLDTPADLANAEVERLANQQGASIGAPSSKARGGADLRNIILAGNNDPQGKGMSAYDRFQELAGHPDRIPGATPGTPSLRDAVSRLIGSPEYAKMPDGDPATKGTKIATLMDLVNKYRSGAKAYMATDNNVRAAEYAEIQRVAKASGQ